VAHSPCGDSCVVIRFLPEASTMLPSASTLDFSSIHADLFAQIDERPDHGGFHRNTVMAPALACRAGAYAVAPIVHLAWHGPGLRRHLGTLHSRSCDRGALCAYSGDRAADSCAATHDGSRTGTEEDPSQIQGKERSVLSRG